MNNTNPLLKHENALLLPSYKQLNILMLSTEVGSATLESSGAAAAATWWKI